MRENKQLALNRMFNLLLSVGVLMFILSQFAFSDAEVGAFSIIILLVSLVFIGYALVFQPFCYLFDKDGVTFCYLFLHNERYLWKNVYKITAEFDHQLDGVLWLISQYFELNGDVEGEPLFYMQGHIRRSRRTKKLIEKYWDGTVTAYLTEDIKKWWTKRRAKDEKKTKAHLTDEIVPMERECRAEFREALDPFIARANLMGLEMKAEYLYITDDFDELRSRPDEDYYYTALIEISENGVEDEDKTVYLYFDLVYVRLGRKAYRGVKNKTALEELNETLNETLEQINTLGIAKVAETDE